MLMRYALAGLLVVALGSDARAEELEERETIQGRVYELLQDGDFGSIEAMANEYRATQARTSSGLWKLTLFYVGQQRAFRSEGHDWALQKAKAWLDRYPQSPAAVLAYADALPDAEGTRRYLEAHKSVAAQDPHWYEMMAQVASAQVWRREQFDKMIDEGLDRAPEYYQLYFAAIDYLGAAEVEGLARQAVERTRKTDGWGAYARIYWYASQSIFGDNLFRQSRVSWPDMKKGVDDVLSRYADGWNLANFLKFACLAGDGPEMKELTRRMDEAAWAVWDEQNYSESCNALGAN
jgi:hypothetical protein